MASRWRSPAQVVAAIAVAWLCSGCAVHWYDQETGTEHIFGFGHMKMKVAPPNEGLQAIVRGTDVLGASVGSADNQAYLTLGWHRCQRLDAIAENTAIRMEWPNSNFASVRVGSEFPGVAPHVQGTPDTPAPAGQNKETEP